MSKLLRLSMLLCAVIAILGVFSISTAQNSAVKPRAGFLNGEKYLALAAPERLAYAVGFINGVIVVPQDLKTGTPSSAVAELFPPACLDTMSGAQVAEIIRKYVQDHPENWDQVLSQLSWNALVDACRSRRQPE
jgi:hypothetical protein